VAAWRWRNVPLPEPHLAAIAAGLVLGFLFPWKLFAVPWPGQVIGLPSVAAGLVLAGWSVAAAGPENLETPAAVVTRGPYAISRNPMYLAWHVLYLGLAFVLNGGWLFALLPVVVVVTHLVILGEERELDALLDRGFREYRQRVRRYL
jgi:protein-S-isoprenylcysteine O-methyltransferase Ste14